MSSSIPAVIVGGLAGLASHYGHHLLSVHLAHKQNQESKVNFPSPAPMDDIAGHQD